MALPSSGQITFSQLASELGNSCSNISLRAYSSCANLTTPDFFTELYGCQCTPIYGTGVWSTGNSLTTSRDSPIGIGQANLGLIVGGNISNTFLKCTEEYNGANWSTANALVSDGRVYSAGLGTQNSGLLIDGQKAGGTALNLTEEYNGSTWCSVNSSIHSVFGVSGAGSQNSAVSMGGGIGNSATSNRTCTEEYNGTTWSTANSTIVCRRSGASSVNGTQNSAAYYGGIYNFPTGLTCTEEYNGTNWSTGGTLNYGRAGQAGGGIQNSAIQSHGYSDPNFTGYNNTEEYNGNVWSTVNNALNCIPVVGYFGSSDSLVVVRCSLTEEYNKPIICVTLS